MAAVQYYIQSNTGQRLQATDQEVTLINPHHNNAGENVTWQFLRTDTIGVYKLMNNNLGTFLQFGINNGFVGMNQNVNANDTNFLLTNGFANSTQIVTMAEALNIDGGQVPIHTSNRGYDWNIVRVRNI